MSRLARRVRVTGRVQGVFYRAWTKQAAAGLGLAGWVRNCADGSVEAHAEGEEDALDQLIERMRRGPPHARVDQVEVEEVAARDLNSFEVRH